MTASAQLIGVLIVMVAVFASTLLPFDSVGRLLAAALIITVGGGTMAFLRSRSG